MSSGSSSSGSSSRGSSSGRSRSSGSSGSTATFVTYSPEIAEIRQTSRAEAERKEGKTVYIKRQDGREEYIESVWEFTGYSFDTGEDLVTRTYKRHYWKAYNTMAEWILAGNIKLSGQNNCFKRLAQNPHPNVKKLDAGHGIYYKPDRDIPTFGRIYPGGQDDSLRKAHIEERTLDAGGRATNRITLRKGERYVIAGDYSAGWTREVIFQRGPELLICDRGKLQEIGFELPGPIGKYDLWLLDGAGRWKGTQPLHCGKTCGSCLQCFARREWPTIDVCEDTEGCYRTMAETGSRARRAGYTPALAEVECGEYILGTYPGSHFYLPRKTIRDVEKVLDRNFAIRDWDHLSEMTDCPRALLAQLFCSVPSLGRRLSRRGASFVPWAQESGMNLGASLKLGVRYLACMFVVQEQAVIELHTGLKVRFEEVNGITHVERDNENYSDRLPEGVDGWVYLGGIGTSV